MSYKKINIFSDSKEQIKRIKFLICFISCMFITSILMNRIEAIRHNKQVKVYKKNVDAQSDVYTEDIVIVR